MSAELSEGSASGPLPGRVDSRDHSFDFSDAEMEDDAARARRGLGSLQCFLEWS